MVLGLAGLAASRRLAELRPNDAIALIMDSESYTVATYVLSPIPACYSEDY